MHAWDWDIIELIIVRVTSLRVYDIYTQISILYTVCLTFSLHVGFASTELTLEARWVYYKNSKVTQQITKIFTQLQIHDPLKSMIVTIIKHGLINVWREKEAHYHFLIRRIHIV